MEGFVSSSLITNLKIRSGNFSHSFDVFFFREIRRRFEDHTRLEPDYPDLRSSPDQKSGPDSSQVTLLISAQLFVPIKRLLLGSMAKT